MYAKENTYPTGNIVMFDSLMGTAKTSKSSLLCTVSLPVTFIKILKKKYNVQSELNPPLNATRGGIKNKWVKK